MDINGVSAIVTGGASGIGAATARLLASKGAKVVVADLQEDKGNELADEIGGAFCKVDVTKTDDIINAIEMAKSMGPLRVLVNSAGIGWAQRTVGRDGTPESAHSLEAFTKVVAINLIGTFDVVRQAATAMSHNDADADGCRGAIVNVASVAAFDGQIGQAAYSASKAGVIGLTLPAARDLAAHGIRVLAIAPGLFETGMSAGMPTKVSQHLIDQTILFPARMGRPEEFAGLVRHIVENAYLNATTISIDAGTRVGTR